MKTTILTFFLTLSFATHAQVPGSFDYQGYLADAAGAPLDETANMIFILYNVPTGGASLWVTAQDVTVSQGLFSVELGGNGAALPPQVFDGPLYLEVIVNGETMQPRRSLRTAPFAFKARDADTIGGLTAEELDFSDEIAQFQNDLRGIRTLPGGAVGSIPPSNAGPQFVGGTVEYSVEQGQSLLTSFTVTLGLSNSAATARAYVSLCAQRLGGGSVTTLNPEVLVDIDGRRRAVSVSGGTDPLAAGTWRIGACVFNDSNQTISNTGSAFGWIGRAN